MLDYHLKNKPLPKLESLDSYTEKIKNLEYIDDYKYEEIETELYKYKYKEIKKELYICVIDTYNYIVFEIDDVIKNDLLKKLLEDIIKYFIYMIGNYLYLYIKKKEYEKTISTLQDLSSDISNQIRDIEYKEDIEYKLDSICGLTENLYDILEYMYDKICPYNNPEYYKDFVKPIIKKNIEELINKKDSHDIIEDLNQIASMTYEGEYCYSNLFIADNVNDLDNINYNLKFKNTINFKDFKDLRKALELGYNNYILVGSIENICGIAKKETLKEISGINISFEGNCSYTISKSFNKEEGIYFKNGYPINKENKFSKKIFIDAIKRNFEELDKNSLDSLYKICEIATKQSKGTILVISSEAKYEAERLSSQSTLMEKPIDLKLNSGLVSNITNIDGAGDKRRGSRYNSTVKYINYIHKREEPKTKCLAIVISEDGIIDIVDYKHINRKVDKKIELLTYSENYIELNKQDIIYYLDRNPTSSIFISMLENYRDLDEKEFRIKEGKYRVVQKLELKSKAQLKIINNYDSESKNSEFGKLLEIRKMYKNSKLIHFKRNEKKEVIEVGVYNIDEDKTLYIDQNKNYSKYVLNNSNIYSIDEFILNDIIQEVIVD